MNSNYISHELLFSEWMTILILKNTNNDPIIGLHATFKIYQLYSVKSKQEYP